MVELVDTPDSKSGSLRRVSVQVRLPLPIYSTLKVRVMGSSIKLKKNYP